MKTKKFADSEDTELFHLLLQSIDFEMPKVISPLGLSLQRQWYIYNNLRSSVTNIGKADTLAPLPDQALPSKSEQKEKGDEKSSKKGKKNEKTLKKEVKEEILKKQKKTEKDTLNKQKVEKETSKKRIKVEKETSKKQKPKRKRV